MFARMLKCLTGGEDSLRGEQETSRSDMVAGCV